MRTTYPQLVITILNENIAGSVQPTVPSTLQAGDVSTLEAISTKGTVVQAATLTRWALFVDSVEHLPPSKKGRDTDATLS